MKVCFFLALSNPEGKHTALVLVADLHWSLIQSSASIWAMRLIRKWRSMRWNCVGLTLGLISRRPLQARWILGVNSHKWTLKSSFQSLYTICFLGLGEAELDGIPFRFGSDLALVSSERKLYCIADFLHQCCTVHGVADIDFANHQLVPKMYPTDWQSVSMANLINTAVFNNFIAHLKSSEIFCFETAGERRRRASPCALQVWLDTCKERCVQRLLSEPLGSEWHCEARRYLSTSLIDLSHLQACVHWSNILRAHGQSATQSSCPGCLGSILDINNWLEQNHPILLEACFTG